MVELIKMYFETPDRVPSSRIRITGTTRTAPPIIAKFNRAAKDSCKAHPALGRGVDGFHEL